MFGRRKREAEAIAAIREEMAAADMRARAVLSNAMGLIELRLSKDADERERIQEASQVAIEHLRAIVVDNATGVGRALEQVARMCTIVAEQIESERVERRMLAEAISQLARPLVGSADPSHVIGGTVVPGAGLEQPELSLLDQDEPRPASETPEPAPVEVLDLEAAHELDRRRAERIVGSAEPRAHRGTRLTSGR